MRLMDEYALMTADDGAAQLPAQPRQGGSLPSVRSRYGTLVKQVRVGAPRWTVVDAAAAASVEEITDSGPRRTIIVSGPPEMPASEPLFTRAPVAAAAATIVGPGAGGAVLSAIGAPSVLCAWGVVAGTITSAATIVAMVQRRRRRRHATPADVTVGLRGWYGTQALTLSHECSRLRKAARDVDEAHGRVEILHAADLAQRAGYSILADAQQVSGAFTRYLDATEHPDEAIVDQVAQRLTDLQAGWLRTTAELAAVIQPVAALADLTRSAVARAELQQALSPVAVGKVDVDAAVAAELLVLVRESVSSSARVLSELRATSPALVE